MHLTIAVIKHSRFHVSYATTLRKGIVIIQASSLHVEVLAFCSRNQCS